MKYFTVGKTRATLVCVAVSLLFLVSCNSMNNPSAVSVEKSLDIIASEIPGSWSQARIGYHSLGWASFNPLTNQYEIVSYGGDIFNTADTFFYMYKPLYGDGSLTINCTEVTVYTHDWAKGGLMIRENLSPESKNFLVALTPGNGITTQWRASTNGSTTWKKGNGEVAPYMLRIKRQGSMITAEKSWNGVQWVFVNQKSIQMASTVYIGIAVSSHANDKFVGLYFTMP